MIPLSGIKRVENRNLIDVYLDFFPPLQLLIISIEFFKLNEIERMESIARNLIYWTGVYFWHHFSFSYHHIQLIFMLSASGFVRVLEYTFSGKIIHFMAWIQSEMHHRHSILTVCIATSTANWTRANDCADKSKWEIFVCSLWRERKRELEIRKNQLTL